MALLLYRFQDLERFQILTAESTAKGEMRLDRTGPGDQSYLRLTVAPRLTDAQAALVFIGLPLLAVDGSPEEILLDVHGDASGCRLFLEAGDARGWGVAYDFGVVDFLEWRTCRADARQPVESWGACQSSGTPQVRPPLQPFRLRISLAGLSERPGVTLGFGALRVAGDVWIASSGFASY